MFDYLIKVLLRAVESLVLILFCFSEAADSVLICFYVSSVITLNTDNQTHLQ